MNKYTIYCTAEQTRKALELGAPIELEIEYPVNLDTLERSPYPDIKMGEDGEPILIIPTAEQMIGWLEGQKGIRYISIDNYFKYGWNYTIFPWTGKSIEQDEFNSREEATLAAIDSALEYLINNKKK